MNNYTIVSEAYNGFLWKHKDPNKQYILDLLGSETRQEAIATAKSMRFKWYFTKVNKQFAAKILIVLVESNDENWRDNIKTFAANVGYFS